MSKKIRSNLMVSAFVILILSGCMPVQTPPQESPPAVNPETPPPRSVRDRTPPADQTVEDEKAEVIEPQVLELNMDMKHYAFVPSSFSAEAGQKVVLNLRSVGGEHDFVIDGMVDSGRIDAGESKSITFTIPESASSGDKIIFYCSVGSHRENGMEGVIVIK